MSTQIAEIKSVPDGKQLDILRWAGSFGLQYTITIEDSEHNMMDITLNRFELVTLIQKLTEGLVV